MVGLRVCIACEGFERRDTPGARHCQPTPSSRAALTARQHERISESVIAVDNFGDKWLGPSENPVLEPFRVMSSPIDSEGQCHRQSANASF